jgi:hypothetical protein
VSITTTNSEALVAVLEHEPIFHPMVGAGPDIVLEPFPCLRDGLE